MTICPTTQFSDGPKKSHCFPIFPVSLIVKTAATTSKLFTVRAQTITLTFIVVLIRNFLIAYDVEPLFMGGVTIPVFFFMNLLFKYFFFPFWWDFKIFLLLSFGVLYPYSGYKSVIRYVIYKHFLQLFSSSFHHIKRSFPSQQTFCIFMKSNLEFKKMMWLVLSVTHLNTLCLIPGNKHLLCFLWKTV